MIGKEDVGKTELRSCSICGENVEMIINFPLLDGTGRFEPRKVARNCRCQREKKEAYENKIKFEEAQSRINELRKLSLMDKKLKDVVFSTYRMSDDNKKAFGIAQKYVENFDEMFKRSQGLLFWGNVGTGKSYTAAAIANELMHRMHSVIMTSFIKLLREMDSMDKDTIYHLNRLNEAKLLVIDDFGAERGTDYALEKVYDIIDSRYRAGKPIVLTTNLRLEDMKNCEDIRYNRIYDRIFEMCYPVKVDGMSWRKKEAIARFEDTKKILEV